MTTIDEDPKPLIWKPEPLPPFKPQQPACIPKIGADQPMYDGEAHGVLTTLRECMDPERCDHSGARWWVHCWQMAIDPYYSLFEGGCDRSEVEPTENPLKAYTSWPFDPKKHSDIARGADGPEPTDEDT